MLVIDANLKNGSRGLANIFDRYGYRYMDSAIRAVEGSSRLNKVGNNQIRHTKLFDHGVGDDSSGFVFWPKQMIVIRLNERTSKDFMVF